MTLQPNSVTSIDENGWITFEPVSRRVRVAQNAERNSNHFTPPNDSSPTIMGEIITFGNNYVLNNFQNRLSFNLNPSERVSYNICKENVQVISSRNQPCIIPDDVEDYSTTRGSPLVSDGISEDIFNLMSEDDIISYNSKEMYGILRNSNQSSLIPYVSKSRDFLLQNSLHLNSSITNLIIDQLDLMYGSHYKISHFSQQTIERGFKLFTTITIDFTGEETLWFTGCCTYKETNSSKQNDSIYIEAERIALIKAVSTIGGCFELRDEVIGSVDESFYLNAVFI